MGKLKYKGYSGTVEYSPEDNCLFGKVLGLRGTLISYEGNSIEEIKKDFEQAVDDYLENCRERGIEPAKPYSGRLVLRMPSELHEDIAETAASIGTTINDFVIRSIKNELRLAH
ncbi:MAG: type II toxin-antitoxin system HicB family antitoxin [Muribaculaceae bacterium]|nr:type II toxin-antitoxin system HicB family antitoxin [Muribaculaceae bacterium]MDE6843180.1 type II toxin-antitoxin system HicB family antitoxin [Muribaculaceae bacterium]